MAFYNPTNFDQEQQPNYLLESLMAPIQRNEMQFYQSPKMFAQESLGLTEKKSPTEMTQFEKLRWLRQQQQQQEEGGW